MLMPVAAYAGKGGGGSPPVTGVSGSLDSVTCSTDTGQGWAYDSGTPNTPVTVFFWIDASPSSYTDTTGNVGSVLANEYRADLCSYLGTCDHGYHFAIPTKYLDGVAHTLRAYGKDTGSANGTAIGAQTFRCYPPPSCSVWFSPNPAQWGQTLTVYWTSSNATSMYINNIGYVTPNVSGQTTVTAGGAYSACIAGGSQSAQKVVYLTSGTQWAVPADWSSSSNSIEVIGGGGGGAHGVAGNGAGGGGGGGAYAKAVNVTLTPGTKVSYAVGSGGLAGTSSSGGNGGDTYFCNSTSNCGSISGSAVVAGAKGGAGGSYVINSVASGGAASASVGNVKYSGGNGGQLLGNGGGMGGGGAAGPHGNGGSGGSADTSSNSGGGGGGGGGGGSSGAQNSGGTGGKGGNNYAGSGGGAASTAGLNGGGGGGGTHAIGGAGGVGYEWDASHGAGGGGGGGGGGSPAQIGGAGALYGGGGGGGAWYYKGPGANGAAGAQGIIVISYGTAKVSCYVPVDYSCSVNGIDTSRKDTNVLQVAAPPPPTATITASANTLPQGATTSVRATFAGTSIDPLSGTAIDFPEGTHISGSTGPDAAKTATFSSQGISTGTQTIFARAITKFYDVWTSFATTNVQIVSAPSCTISFDKNPIPQGQSTTVRWSSSGADTFSINTIGTVTPNVSGSAIVSPMHATDYTGTATKSGYPFYCKAATGNPAGTLNVSCTPSYSCSGNTIMYTDSACNTAPYPPTAPACAAPSFCSVGSSTCLYPSPQFNQSGSGLTGHLQLSPQVVRSTKTTTVNWNVSYVSGCTVKGDNGDSWTGVSGSQTSKPIVQQTVYTLLCQGLDGSTVSESESVNILPTFQEQ
jgi:hypothetical protein